MNYLITIWVAIMSAMAPAAPRERLERIAGVVANATTNSEEQAMLLTVSFYETTFGARGIPFGATGRYAAIERLRRSTGRGPMSEAEAAGSVLAIVRRARSWCPRASIAGRLGHFHHGHGCAPDPYSRREQRTAERMLQQLRRHMLSMNSPPR